jgi:hypothetical protein
MTAIKKLTGMNGDIRQIAKLLQAKAPPGHKLAYINEEEAQLLKSRGGSGRITEAGIPSYDTTDPYSSAFQGDVTTQPSYPQTPVQSVEAPPTPPSTTSESAAPSVFPESNTGETSTTSTPTTSTPILDYSSPPSAGVPLNAPVTSGLSPTIDYSLTPAGTTFTPGGTAVGQTTEGGVPQLGQPGGQPLAPSDTTPDKSLYQKAIDALSQPKSLAALGIGGAQALLGASSVRKAQNEAAQAQAQLQAMAAPYQQQGQQLQQYALQGQLTPANQQTLDAARAQLAQGAASRGGVGNQQVANQIATLTNSLLANQLNAGIQLQQVGDKIAQGAIQTGIQANQYINQITSNYAQNIARVVAGAAGLPGQTQTTTTVTNP